MRTTLYIELTSCKTVKKRVPNNTFIEANLSAWSSLGYGARGNKDTFNASLQIGSAFPGARERGKAKINREVGHSSIFPNKSSSRHIKQSGEYGKYRKNRFQ